MERARKVELVESMNSLFRQVPHAIVASFRGLTVNQASELRARVREVGGTYQVVKNRLAKRAMADTGAAVLADAMSGPCAVATHQDDPVALAKALAEFAKANPQLELIAGLVDARERIDSEGVKRLATMPALPELQAQLLALINTPATMLVRLINTPGGQVARVVDARREALGGGGDAAVASGAAEDS